MFCKNMPAYTGRPAWRTCRYGGGIPVAVDRRLMPRHDKNSTTHLTHSRRGTSRQVPRDDVVAESITAVPE